MVRARWVRMLAAALALSLAAAPAQAQVTQLTGKVLLKHPDGEVEPVAGALIDVYRVDISQKLELKSDKRGQFRHVGLPTAGTYIVAVSAPGAAPDYLDGIRPTPRADLELTLTLKPGTGARLTLDEIKAAIAKKAAAPAPPAPKSNAADVARMLAEIEAANKKIQAENELITRLFKEGNAAYQAKEYDKAISLYDQALAVRPEEAALLTNKSNALQSRGVGRYNSGLRQKDAALRQSGLQDFRTAAELAAKAVKATEGAATPEGAAGQNRLAALGSRAEALRLVARVEPVETEAAAEAYRKLMEFQKDPSDKRRTHLALARLFAEGGAYDRALPELRKILKEDPENLDAAYYFALGIVSTEERAAYPEAAQHLERFLARAPETDPRKAEAKELLEFLRKPSE